jgi:hypothetical protein
MPLLQQVQSIITPPATDHQIFFRINTQLVDTEKGYQWAVIVLTVK